MRLLKTQVLQNKTKRTKFTKNFSSSHVSFKFHSHLQFLTILYSILLDLTFKSFIGLHQQDQIKT